ncbi:Gfo/Idh/MocA family oxidoreductase [Phragmitibacter flavus]|uniref:Gfo/Idh/MocA family oxidoreductase n=1 Tax=Phragmitibacter flavus TaxID=2576071 RepID=A0A5R8K9Q9_9BACT|nr:Gfo/Idh/MocA family oxidoreductase [Phragmitibacter flavus]TLD68655.1 Gfo/Idh/MocA family oxidoreductase [Phragmitibacter flavus]
MSMPTPPPAHSPLSRRRFVTSTAAAAFGFQFVPRHVIGGPGFTPPSEKVNLGCIGVGGQGAGVIADLEKSGLANIVTLCDVDTKHAANTIAKYPNAKLHSDYRKLIESHKDIDAVVICTPDHLHAPASLLAMRAGRHVYVEKPLAHSIGEARKMAEVAKETGLVTQMGNQGHAGEGLRLTREWIQAGAIGKVTEVHVWSDRPGKFWDSQGKAFPTDTPPTPETLDWNLWQGPVKERAYHPEICPRRWRGWWDYGCGALGDMAVHNADPAFYALDLGQPDWVESEHAENNNQSYPAWSIITYHFPARGEQPPVRMVWYDGGKKPANPPGFEAGRELGDNGIYFVGDKGVLLAPGWAGTPRLVPEEKMSELVANMPPKTIARCTVGHRQEWLEAIKANKPENAHSGFHYSAPFTEALLVGLLATRFNKRIEWDSINLKALNEPNADAIIHKVYRDGFGI